ncbi:unnamed protein product [Dracunculus medinensis]|uniref:DDE_Tnp_1_7 domain-containing protein n=1 Tax=Dracunculus medinensis TaxID=318479 RepID=A0A0N4UPV7_DRAME|nr:unnamed protein product [Dracunculus medinensis]
MSSIRLVERSFEDDGMLQCFREEHSTHKGSHREITITKDKVYLAAICSNLLYCCAMWPMKVEDIKKMSGTLDQSCLTGLRRADKIAYPHMIV